jgi:hypothetical protein
VSFLGSFSITLSGPGHTANAAAGFRLVSEVRNENELSSTSPAAELAPRSASQSPETKGGTLELSENRGRSITFQYEQEYQVRVGLQEHDCRVLDQVFDPA